MPPSVFSAPRIGKKSNLVNTLKNIHAFSILEAEEEFQLAKNWQEKNDPEAMDRLVKSHLRLVNKIALGYRGYGLPLHDLVAEGTIGMMQAVKKFEPEKGFRLSTYARWWIQAAIKDYVMRTWSLVKIGTTAAQKKLFFKVRSVKEKLEKELAGSALTPAHLKKIAQDFEVTEQEVIDMLQRLAGTEYSLNMAVHQEEEGIWQDWLIDESQDIESTVAEQEEWLRRHETLQTSLSALNRREYRVFTERRLQDPPKTLEILSQELNISRERVRQIEVAAFEKIQKEMVRERSQWPLSSHISS